MQNTPTHDSDSGKKYGVYRIEVAVGEHGEVPKVVAERLSLLKPDKVVFDSLPKGYTSEQIDPFRIVVQVGTGGKRGRPPHLQFLNTQSVLSQMVDHPDPLTRPARESARQAMHALASMRFLDLDPEAMRRPTIPGQVNLGDRGENLSSVLQAMCQDTDRRAALVSWVQSLTPMDATDFEFPPDQIGRILLTLVESSGRKTSAYSASDGTLRLLAMIAALLGTEPARFYFLEELENGIHPNRVYLLLDLIERQVAAGAIQVVASTHSPQILRLASPTTLENASLTYRLEGSHEGKIRRIVDIPDAANVVRSHDLARLHESGWFENVVSFADAVKSDE